MGLEEMDATSTLLTQFFSQEDILSKFAFLSRVVVRFPWEKITMLSGRE